MKFKNLIYLASTLLMVLFCLTSCQKEDISDIEQTVANKKSNTTVAARAPGVIISNYDDVYIGCCLHSQYTMKNTTHNFFIVNQNLIYKVTFTKGSQESILYTANQTFNKYWVTGDTHNVKVEIVDQNGSNASNSSYYGSFFSIAGCTC